LRLTGSLSERASSKILRTPDASIERIRSATQRSEWSNGIPQIAPGLPGVLALQTPGKPGAISRHPGKPGRSRRGPLDVILEVVAPLPVQPHQRLVDRQRPVAVAGLRRDPELDQLVQGVADLEVALQIQPPLQVQLDVVVELLGGPAFRRGVPP